MISIWVFALWTLITIFQDGITGVEWVSSLLMLGISWLPLWSPGLCSKKPISRITTGDHGITYTRSAE